ncbi:MAG TPA: serine hydrolase [Longimicrobiales bacterium]|nr:serine hydrolase [Longimicrobiales bacterium]
MKQHPPAMAGAAVLVFAAAAALRAQEAPGLQASLDAADALVADWVDAERVPGAVLLVAKDGEVVLEKAYGWAQLYDYGEGEYGASAAGEARPEALRRLQRPPPMDASTAFDLASVTKVMATTFAVMLLVDRGLLDLDAPVSRYLPDFAGGGKDAITLRHLLTHRAGLLQWVPTYYHAADADGAYAYIRDLPLGWRVGEGRHYSDLGFMLLGRVVEQVSRTPLDRYLRRELYEPLGLTSTGFRAPGEAQPGSAPIFAATSHGNPYEQRMVHDSTFGYRIAGDPDAWDGWRRHTLVGEVNDGNSFHAFGGVAGHAGLFSTAGDLGVLLRLLVKRGEVGGRRYLRAETVDVFMAPTGDGQALGWQVPGYAPPGSFVHTGFTGTYVLGVPEEGLGVILLTARQNVGLDDRGLYPDVGPLQRGVAASLVGAGG